MKVTTTPIKQKFLTAEDRKERGGRTKVAVLTFDLGKPVHRSDFLCSEDLSRAFSNPSSFNDDVHARLIVVEDLSRDVIEILGARFDIDPLFFRNFISDYLWFNTRDRFHEHPDLDIMARKRSHVIVRFMQTRYFRTTASLKQAKWECGGFNVLRRLNKDETHLRCVDLPGSDVGFIRSRSSLWIRPNKAGEKGVLGELFSIYLAHPSTFACWRVDC